MPAKIGPNQQATLRCKVDTGAGGSVMPLHAFSKLFPRHVTTDGTPKGLRPTRTHLTAYNGYVWNIGHCNLLETRREEHHQMITHLLVHS